MIRAFTFLVLATATAVVTASQASAQSRDFMRNECSNAAQTYFRDFTAATDMKYNGQRVDGTHAINGRIFLETRSEDFACSYAADGRRMVEFYAEGRLRPAYLPTSPQPTPPANGMVVQVTGVPGGDVLNVRSGPGTGNRIVGALSNGTSVRQLDCRMVGKSRWCQIEMMTDMRERGWVNARYLTKGSATHLPGDAVVPGTGYNATGRIPCTNLPGGAMFDCAFGVRRTGNGNATLVVTFPAANARTMTFRGGVPVSADVAAALSYSRASGMTVVRIGNTERFRIPDAVLYGG
ncbi:SH3 domain-containing protein [uncultured Mameliella sp.]|uniref:SH3 domain-containing protein n=1 Tax=uncultured Mameliella sp. TaxID=1447087 RepID=UPI00261BD77E|nr:SH3 domain-containing protein [uncultured Mameliella sp.]